MPSQMTDHAAMVVLGHRFAVHLDRSRLAVGATAFAAGEELMAIDRRDPRPSSRSEGLVAPHLMVDRGEHPPQRSAVQLDKDPADRIATGNAGTDDPAQPRRKPGFLVEAV